jgi:hypothetical protein
MSGFRLSPEADAELDGIWIHIASESSSIDIATRVVDDIMERFWLLARYRTSGDGATTFVRTCPVSQPMAMSSFTASRRTTLC